ncbi:MFS transporter [Streptomyces erythrochromogenes]|uniref:MFS transporter n=1 Tax=Streptomyces erythrochromogenes TaxID=285574 RepID=UPI0030B87827
MPPPCRAPSHPRRRDRAVRTHPACAAPPPRPRTTAPGFLCFTPLNPLPPLVRSHLPRRAPWPYFGLIAGVSAIFAMVFNPVVGALSDRSGRRNPWILGGGPAAVPAMFLLGFADTILLITIAWCLGQAVMNVYQAAITSVVPDRVPVSARG